MTKSVIYARATLYPKKAWLWPHFKPSEIACKDGSLMVDSEAMDKLEAFRVRAGVPFRVLSAYRSPAHNAKVGGAKRSYHMLAEAFDIEMKGHDPHEFEAMAREMGFNGIGRYPAQGFMHIDTRDTPATWGDAFPFGEDDPAPKPAPIIPPAVAEVAGAALDGAVAGAVDAVAEIATRKARVRRGTGWVTVLLDILA